jgi:quercetin dioxygenase-like cupin family protein
MGLKLKPLRTGDLYAVIMIFENEGDKLPMHNHTEDDLHITIVTRGKLRIYGPEIGSADYEASDVIDFNAGEPHEFMALEDDTRLVNIVKKHLDLVKWGP